jgi:hypothetical protein
MCWHTDAKDSFTDGTETLSNQHTANQDDWESPDRDPHFTVFKFTPHRPSIDFHEFRKGMNILATAG